MKKVMKKVMCAFLVVGIVLTSSVMSFAATAGDVNSDSKVNSTDALAILKYAVGATPSKFDKSVADVNADGKINSTDALKVLQITVGNVQTPTVVTKADVIRLFNAETAKAAKGSYNITRTGRFVKPIDVGSATSALNSIITGVDKNASLDSVVGDFLGIKAQPITGTVNAGKGEGFDAKYMIKAMNLTDADVLNFRIDGNKYTITVKDCTNPNASSSMAHATNDYITYAEVNQSLTNEVGSAVKIIENESTANYKKITFVATIVDGKMTTLEYTYSFDATLKIKIAIINATGTGEAIITGKYTDIKY